MPMCLNLHGRAFAMHIWEGPSINTPELHEDDIFGVLRYYMTRPESVLYFQPGARTTCYIMAGTRAVISGDGDDERATLTRSDSRGAVHDGVVNSIEDSIKSLRPGTIVSKYVYARQLSSAARELRYGKAAVIYDPNEGSQQGNPLSGTASVAVFLQGFKATQIWLGMQQVQIWRVSPRVGQSFNRAFMSMYGQAFFPCEGDLEDENAVASNAVEVGSTDVSVTDPFNWYTLQGENILQNCRFLAAPYAATAESGINAGELVCDYNGGLTTRLNCIRQYNNQATTCGGRPASDCGEFGKNCDRYFQHIANCFGA